MTRARPPLRAPSASLGFGSMLRWAAGCPASFRPDRPGRAGPRNMTFPVVTAAHDPAVARSMWPESLQLAHCRRHVRSPLIRGPTVRQNEDLGAVRS